MDNGGGAFFGIGTTGGGAFFGTATTRGGAFFGAILAKYVLLQGITAYDASQNDYG